VASLQPVPSMQQAAGMIAGGSAKVPVLETLNTMKQGGCNTRALELDAPPSGCVRSRGLTYDDPAPSAGAGSSLSLRTEAADSTIAGVFAFQHVN